MSEMNDRDAAIISKAVSELSPHFDSIHIFATRHEGSDTLTISKGHGNWYARFGQIQEWLARTDEQTRVNSRKDFED